MKYRYHLDPVAANEFEAAYSWYIERSLKAADNFLKAIENAIASICAEPQRYRKMHKELREIIVKKYPFYIIYLIDEKKKLVIITSVYHNKRDPQKKYNK